MHHVLRTLFAGALLVTALAVVACGDDEEADDDGAPTAATGEVQLTQDDDGKSVTLAADDALIVTLPSNPSTGFSWAIGSPEPQFLELQGEPEFVPEGSTTPAVGAGGTQVFTFKATGVGTSVLSMEYKRTTTPPSDPEETFKVTVETK